MELLFGHGIGFDDEAKAILKQLTEDNDYELRKEVVDESGKIGIYIEDSYD